MQSWPTTNGRLGRTTANKLPVQARKVVLCVFGAAWLATAIIKSAWAEDAVNIEYLERQGVGDRLRPDDVNLLGDLIDFNSGSVVFKQMDISLPGNSHLEVAFWRSRQGGLLSQNISGSPLGDWVIEVPRIRTIIASGEYQYTWKAARCSETWGPPTVEKYAYVYEPWEYWNGVSLEIPGHGATELVDGAPPFAPSGTTKTTMGNWAFTCIADIGTANGGGEGFIGIAPNGDRYRFDLLKYTTAMGINKGKLMGRRNGLLLATEVTDVNGNWVHYQYDSTKRLIGITSNDGRSISITYTSTGATVIANGRTWTYTVTSGLTQVTLPDGRFWSYSGLAALDTVIDACNPATASLTVTHPNGVTGTFVLTKTKHGRTYVPDYPQGPPITPPNCQDWKYIQSRFYVMSLTSKTLSGPGYSSATWTYSYSGDDGCYKASCGLPDAKWTLVTDPLGNRKKLYYDRRFNAYEGLLVKEEVYNSSDVLQRTSETSYIIEPEIAVGADWMPYENWLPKITPRHASQTIITRGSDTYTTRYTYDNDQTSSQYSYGYPTLTETWSSVSPTHRVTDAVYAHNKTLWVLGQPSTVTKNGVLFDSYTYDSLARVYQHSKFGVLAETFTYHADGDDGGVAEAGALASATDALGQVVSFHNFKRGLPQQVIRKDNVSIYRVLDDNGWVTSETNARGTVTGYAYNSVGWLTAVTRPAGWANTAIAYSGLGSGVTQVATRGNGRVTTVYDGLTRPISAETEDLTGHEAPVYTATTYDALSQVTFQSWPSNSSSPTAGVNNTYDALGRALCATETVSPNAATCNAYLTGNVVQTTDPVGAVTTTSRSAYGTPDNGDVLQVVDPLGATTALTRDIFGKVTQLTRSGTQNGTTASVTRQFWYDGRQRLCRRHAPEQGDELFAYDGLDRMSARAEGQSAGTDCAAPPSASAITTTYDTLDRPVATGYPAGTSSISRSFDANGNVLTVSRGASVWTYTYNELDLPASETLAIDGRSYAYAYGYDAAGNLATTTDPSGTGFSFAPDGMGRSTQIAAGGTYYLSGIGYAPNGLVTSAAFGNGQVLTESLNDRQLPNRVWVAKSGGQTAMDLTYGYSARRQVSSIADAVNAGSNRAFTYDGAGRLLTAAGPWGAGSYSYDALDNLRQTVLGSRTIAATYDPTTNRVATVTDSNGGGTRTYGFDASGNTVTDGLRIIGHDAADQPVSVSQGGYSSTFAYDGNLKRVKQTTQGGAVTYTVYSKASALVYRDEVNAARHTTYLGAGPAQLRLVNGVPTYSHSDTQGSVVAATDAAGAVLWRERYTPYGDTIDNPAGNRDDTGYTGYLRDTDFGLDYAQARYYDPVTGRFLEPDPLREADQINLYAYVGNDPMDKTDPSGLADLDYFNHRAQQFDSDNQGLADIATQLNMGPTYYTIIGHGNWEGGGIYDMRNEKFVPGGLEGGRWVTSGAQLRGDMSNYHGQIPIIVSCTVGRTVVPQELADKTGRPVYSSAAIVKPVEGKTGGFLGFGTQRTVTLTTTSGFKVSYPQGWAGAHFRDIQSITINTSTGKATINWAPQTDTKTFKN